MIAVTYPEPAFRIKKEKERDFIFDALRKSWVLLTEEEWVRQNFIQYLIKELHYPAAMIAVEKEIYLNELRKRFDILIFDCNHQPWMLVECKAAAVNMSDTVLQQVMRYNISTPVNFVVITNGHFTYGWEKKEGELKILQHMPPWRIER
jgi:hypothetical protein